MSTSSRAPSVVSGATGADPSRHLLALAARAASEQRIAGLHELAARHHGRESLLELRREMHAEECLLEALTGRLHAVDEAAARGAALHEAPPSTTAGPPVAAVRAVLAFRRVSYGEVLAGRLARAGVDVIACTQDGAVACGVVMAEQPDIVLLEEMLPSLSGREVLQRLLEFAPLTLLAVEAADGRSQAGLRAVGAHVVVTRLTTPDVVVDSLLSHSRRS